MSEPTDVAVREMVTLAAQDARSGPQAALLAFVEAKLTETRAHIAEMEEAVRVSLKQGFSVLPLRRALDRAKKPIVFYEKVAMALQAGYVVMPLINCEVFAVRIDKKKRLPAENGVENPRSWSQDGDTIKPVPSGELAAGEGWYVAPEVTFKARWHRLPDQVKPGEDRWLRKDIPIGFIDEVPFPVSMCKPSIMDAASRAMALAVFDDIAISPNRGVKKQDPIIIGRINRPGKKRSPVCFMIAWLVRVEDVLA